MSKTAKANARRMLWPVMIYMLILSIIGMSASPALAGETASATAVPTAQSDEEDVTLATAKANVEMVQDGRAIVLARGNRSLVDSVPPLVDIAQVVGARDHTCALTTTGGIKCWGKNRDGELGTGDTQHRLTPANVVGLNSGMLAVATGYNHTCALTTAGGVKCWGVNDHGQLGDGTGDGIARTSPVDVPGYASGVTAIATGRSHTCIMTTTGGVKCWGRNDVGQLGDGTTQSRLSPVDVTGLNGGVIAIAAGGSSSCALTTAGGVKCWGTNDHGQLGDGTAQEQFSPVPADVTGLSNGVTAIALSGYHTCALTAAGGVKCWGANDYGQLGDGTTTQRLTPVDVAGLSSAVTTISAGGAAGGSHTCVQTAAAGAKCWGWNNQFGQLGDGTVTNRSTPVDVTGLSSGVSAITAGGFHTCALTTEKRVKCWGDNYFGQLGNNTTWESFIPVDVLMPFDSILFLPLLVR